MIFNVIPFQNDNTVNVTPVNKRCYCESYASYKKYVIVDVMLVIKNMPL